MSDHLEAVPDSETDPDDCIAWLKRWGGSEILLDDQRRWSIFSEPDWRQYPDKQSAADTASYALHVMSADAIAVLDDDDAIDHWRRLDRDTHVYRPLPSKALRALVVAILGDVGTDSQVNNALKLMDDIAMGPPDRIDDVELGRPKCVPKSELDKTPRYRPALNGWADLATNTLIDDIDEIKALGLYRTKCWRVPFVPDCDLDDPDIAERMEFLFDGWEPNEDPDDEWTDEAYFWAEAGHTCWEKPGRRIPVVIGPSGAGKSTKLAAIVAADGDFAQDGRISDLTEKAHEPRFAVRRAWCEASFVAYDDGPDGRWHWSSILPGSAGAIMPCEKKNVQEQERLPSISTPWIAMNPGRLKWVGVNVEGAPERLRIIKLLERPLEEQDPEDRLDEYGYDSVQEMVTKDLKLHMGINARRARNAAQWRRKPPLSANVERNGDEIQDLSLPPLEAWLTRRLAFGADQAVPGGWRDIMRAAAADHPEDSVDPWPLDEFLDDYNGKTKLVITVPRKGGGGSKGDGLDRLNEQAFAKRARDLFTEEFKHVKRTPQGGVGKLLGVGLDH